MHIPNTILKKPNTDQITNIEVMHGTTRLIIEFHPNVKIPVFRPSSEITKLHERESERNEEEMKTEEIMDRRVAGIRVDARAWRSAMVKNSIEEHLLLPIQNM